MNSRKFMWIGSSAILLLMVFCIVKNFYQLKSQTPNEKVINTADSNNNTKPIVTIVSSDNKTIIDTKSEVNLTEQLMNKLIAQREIELETKTEMTDEKNLTDETYTTKPILKIVQEEIQINNILKENKIMTPLKEPVNQNNNSKITHVKKKKHKVSKTDYKIPKVHKKRAIEIDEIITNETLNFTNATRLSRATKHKLNSLIKKMKRHHNSILKINLDYQNLKALKMVGKYLVNHGIPRDAIQIVNQRAKKPIIITSSDHHREVEVSLVEQRN